MKKYKLIDAGYGTTPVGTIFSEEEYKFFIQGMTLAGWDKTKTEKVFEDMFEEIEVEEEIKKKDVKNSDKKEIDYEKFAWKNADRTDMYDSVIHELIHETLSRKGGGYAPAENEDDYAKLTIGVNYLGKYCVQLANQVITYTGEKLQLTEEQEDRVRSDIGLGELSKLINKDTKRT